MTDEPELTRLSEHGERIRALETWSRGHEDLCASRYGNLAEMVKGLYTRLWAAVGAIITLLITSAMWLGGQLYHDKFDPPPVVPAQITTPAAQPVPPQP